MYQPWIEKYRPQKLDDIVLAKKINDFKEHDKR